jgi:hypothetical protein
MMQVNGMANSGMLQIIPGWIFQNYFLIPKKLWNLKLWLGHVVNNRRMVLTLEEEAIFL